MVWLWGPFNLSEPQFSVLDNGVNAMYLSGLSGFNEIKNSCFCCHTCLKTQVSFNLLDTLGNDLRINLAFAHDPCYP